MAVLNSEKQIEMKNTLKQEYPWFYSNILTNVQKSLDEFFQKKYALKLVGISYDENILFYGDEYFINKININKNSSLTIRLSSLFVSSILDNTLGISDNIFSLKTLSKLELNLIKDYTNYIYENIAKFINKTEVNKKVIKNSKEYNITFYAQYKKEYAGKIIITIPEYMLDDIEIKEFKPVFDIDDFKNTGVGVSIGTGKTRVPLNDVKALEVGDIIVLEESDINKMAVLWNGQIIPFSIVPNPSLIISIDSNGGNEMEEDTSLNTPNMWDSILVDIVAEFDNVKLSLGELKQISEGLVIDIGSVYDNKVKLRVENQVVATGELVILNDRYGVRIDKVKKSKEEPVKQPVEKPAEKPAPAPSNAKKTLPPPKAGQSGKKPIPPKNAKQPNKGDENFDYSDFEIEDESI
ncbi:FliM/FliN family flagellar motor switch protein [bacterium]|nr:FliM/FliN family flagellar motor switch protein [bacterium]